MITYHETEIYLYGPNDQEYSGKLKLMIELYDSSDHIIGISIDQIISSEPPMPQWVTHEDIVDQIHAGDDTHELLLDYYNWEKEEYPTDPLPYWKPL